MDTQTSVDLAASKTKAMKYGLLGGDHACLRVYEDDQDHDVEYN